MMSKVQTDNGKEFLNYLLYHYCRDESITFTRSRPYKKNDQCHVEQKNGSVVRKFVGYDRFEGIEPCQVLEALYEPLRLYVNFFQPSLKLISKQREGSRVIKKYDAAQTPCQRVVADETISAESKQALEEQFKRLDPIALLAEIERLQDQLWQYAYVGRRGVTAPISRNGTNQAALTEQRNPQRESMESERSVEAVPSDNNVQLSGNQEASGATDPSADASPDRSERMYRRAKRARKQVQGKRWWRTRKDPFAEVWEEVEQQLERTPDIYATTLFAWLQEKYPGEFPDGQLRTLQRRVKAWRVEQATCRLESQGESGME